MMNVRLNWLLCKTVPSHRFSLFLWFVYGRGYELAQGFFFWPVFSKPFEITSIEIAVA